MFSVSVVPAFVVVGKTLDLLLSVEIAVVVKGLWIGGFDSLGAALDLQTHLRLCFCFLVLQDTDLVGCPRFSTKGALRFAQCFQLDRCFWDISNC